MKKIHGLLLGCGLLSAAAATGFFISSKTNVYQEVKADAVDSFYIGGQELTTEAPVAGDSGEATLTLTDTLATITFDNFKYSGVGTEVVTGKYASFYIDIKSTRNVTVIVKGENELNNTITSEEYYSYGMYLSFYYGDYHVAALDFKSSTEEGKHSLTVSGSSEGTKESIGLCYNVANVTFNGPDITIAGGDNATEGSGGISTLNNKGQFLDFRSGKAVVTGGSTAGSSYGMSLAGTTVKVSGDNAVLECRGGTAGYKSYGISARSDAYFSAGSTLISGNNIGFTTYTTEYIYVNGTADFTLLGNQRSIGLYNKIVNSIRGYTWVGEGSKAEFLLHSEPTELPNDVTKLFLGELEFTATPAGQAEYTGSGIPVVDIKPTKPSSNYEILYGYTDGVYDLEEAPTRKDVGETATVYYKVSAENYHAKDGTLSVTGSGSIEVVKATGTVESEAVAATGLVYNGQSQDLLSTLPVAKASGTIVYSVNDEGFTTHPPVGRSTGTYAIKYRVRADGSHYASSDYQLYVTIAKADGVIETEAEAAEGLLYTGEEQDLLSTIPTAELDGVIEYSVNDGDFSADEPVGVDAGNYVIKYRVMEDDAHKESDVETINVIIGKADNSYIKEPQPNKNIFYNGHDRELVSEGQATAGTIYYKIGDGEYAAAIPVQTNVGEYVVYYKVIGDDNYNDIEEKSITVSISPVDRDALKEIIKTAEEYRDQLKDDEDDVASALNEVIEAAIAVRDDDNKTTKEVSNAITSVENGIKNARISYVVAKINKIPNPVTFTDECYQAMGVAKDAYSKLTSELKKKVTNYSTLTGANVTFVKLAIDDIGEVVFTDESKAKIDAARAYYKAINGTERSLVKNYSTLQAAENRYNELKEDYEAASSVIDLIDKLGKATYTEAFKTKLTNARVAYDALSDVQKALVNNLKTLEEGELFYNQILDAIKKIDVIGGVVYPDSSKDITAARESYDGLSDEQKEYVNNITDLLEAEQYYSEVDNAVKLIDAIGEVKYPDSGKAISDAKSAYDALSDDQKLFVSNYDTLSTAKGFYYGIDSVFNYIKAIGEITYPDSEKVIENARSAYDVLSEEQQAFVDKDTYQTLLDAETNYKEIKENHLAAEEVVTLIDNIGRVEYSTACKNRIDKAREKYDALTNDAQRSYVTNYATLETAETSYENTKTNHDAADKTIEAINAIGEVNLSGTSQEKIRIARNAYNGLTDEQKALVNPEVLALLTEAETTYSSLMSNQFIWLIVGSAVGGFFALLFLIYLLSFFVFNKWALIDDRVVRAVKLGKKYGAYKVMVMPLRIYYCDKDILFNRKKQAKNKQALDKEERTHR